MRGVQCPYSHAPQPTAKAKAAPTTSAWGAKVPAAVAILASTASHSWNGWGRKGRRMSWLCWGFAETRVITPFEFPHCGRAKSRNSYCWYVESRLQSSCKNVPVAYLPPCVVHWSAMWRKLLYFCMVTFPASHVDSTYLNLWCFCARWYHSSPPYWTSCSYIPVACDHYLWPHLTSSIAWRGVERTELIMMLMGFPQKVQSNLTRGSSGPTLCLARVVKQADPTLCLARVVKQNLEVTFRKFQSSAKAQSGMGCLAVKWIANPKNLLKASQQTIWWLIYQSPGTVTLVSERSSMKHRTADMKTWVKFQPSRSSADRSFKNLLG